MADVYQEPIEIIVEAPSSFTEAAFNKVLLVTTEHKSGASDTETPSINIFSSSKEVSEFYGNNSKTLVAVEAFLKQKRYPSKQPLKPTFFTVLSIKKTATAKADVIEGLNTALGHEWYGLYLVDISKTILANGDLNTFLNENRKVLFRDTDDETVADADKSSRTIILKRHEDECQAACYMATVITPGAGSKDYMNIVSGCTPTANAISDRVKLTAANINFTRKATSKEYVVVENGVATDSTAVSDTTAIDCIVYNLTDNLEIHMAERGVEQDERGYDALTNKVKDVMNNMGVMGLLAVANGMYEYKIQPITQNAVDRQLRRIFVVVEFRLKGWAKAIKLTLSRSYDTVNGGDQ